jgi:plasmid stability protein
MVVLQLKQRAQRNGNTLEGEVRALLTEAALAPQRELAEQLRKAQEEMREKYGELPDSTPFIRAMRDGKL